MKWLTSVYSDGSKYFVSNPLPKKGEEIEIRIRVKKNSKLKYVIFRTKLNGIEVLKEMNIVKENLSNQNFVYYSVKCICYEDILHYHFYLVTNDKIYYYNQLEITDYIPNEYYDFKILFDYLQPSWVKESVFYQIFPDRFYNGNKDNDVLTDEYSFDGHKTIKVDDWNKKPLPYEHSFCLDFYGGDLNGIEEKIPYLKKLGVTALYLNPIFYAATVHKYDCLDYFTIDPHFGGNKALESLTKALHKNNMYIVLDVSINHTGINHKWFNKNGDFYSKSIGAYNNKDSLERNYYFFNNDNSYHSWLGVSTLPTLNYSSMKLREIIYQGKDSFIRKWLRTPYEIDGWRFDVADIMARNDRLQLHHVVWPEIRKVIKEENVNAYLLAEDWSDCDEYLRGNEWDSSMNYFGFTRPVREFVGEVDLFNRRNNILNFQSKMTAKMLLNRFKTHLSKLPFVIMQNQFNLIDSHDVPRLHNNNKINRGDLSIAICMLFTMIGTPSIYYGDEVNIDGTIDTNEGCRYPFPWDNRTNKNDLYEKLAHLKHESDALKYGSLKFLPLDDNYLYTCGYVRFSNEELLINIFSTDDDYSYINIPLLDYKNDLTFPKIDFLGNTLDYIINDDCIKMRVEPHKAYIIRIKY